MVAIAPKPFMLCGPPLNFICRKLEDESLFLYEAFLYNKALSFMLLITISNAPSLSKSDTEAPNENYV